MSHGSLFTGVGLLDHGLVLAGLDEPVWVCERDDWRRDTILARRFPRAVRRDDVRTVGADTVEPVRLIVGGFPCKGASTAGKRNGFDHPETVLWREMARAVRELRPRHVLLENVANLLALGGGAVWGEVLGDLASLGFDVEWDCIPAAAVGAPHRRDRVFAVATHPDRGVGRADQGERGLHDRALGVPGGRREDPDQHGAGRSAPAADAGRERGELRGGPGVVAGTGGPAAGEARERQRARDAARGGREAVADADVAGREEQHGPAVADGPQLVGVAVAGREPVAVGWGPYAAAVERWERELGRPAPSPLVRRVDDRRATRLDRSRLSALGDGVQVQVGRLMGEHLLSIDPSLAATREVD